MCKKKLIYLFSSVLVLGLASNAAAGLVAHWRLDEGSGTTVYDSSGNNHHGTLNGNPSWVAGKIGGALELDGDGDYVDFGNPSDLPSGKAGRSICGWGKTDTVGSGYRWIAAYGTPTMGQAFFIGLNGTTIIGGGYWGDDVLHSNFWEVDVWHHICLTYDGTTARLYADGIEVASIPKDWNLVLSRVFIGEQVNNAAELWVGVVDDVRIYDYVLSEGEVKAAMVGEGYPYALGPIPADGALHEDTWVNLSWRAGDFAVSHDVYFGENYDDVNSGLANTFQGSQTSTFFVVGFPGFPYPDGLIPGTTYYWRIDEVNDTEPNSPWKGDVWSLTVPSMTAYDPIPADGAKFIDPDVQLSWTAGFNAKLHTAYFSDNFDDVNNAAGGLPQGTTTYSPGPLELEKTYYWRIDEFDAITTHRGDVWSFRTVPEIPVQDPNLVCWWKLDEGQGITAVDWSGYGNHGTLIGGPLWVTGYDGGALELDGGDDYVNFGDTPNWPAGTSSRSMCGWGKTNSIAGGWRWIAAYGSAGTSLAMFIGMNGDDLFGGGYGDDVRYDDFWEVNVWHHICLTYDGTRARLYADGIEVAADAKNWDLALGRAHIGRQVNNAAEFWDGLVDDVRIYTRVLTPEEIKQAMRGDPLLAWQPSPADGSTPDIEMATPLSWSTGDNASQHDVYFGIDKDAVTDADESDATGIYRGRQSATNYNPPEDVEWGGGPYYWRIDEYNTDGTISTGRTWSFSVADYLIVDDFEDYDVGNNEIWWAWIDGLGYASHPTLPAHPGNGTGSIVGDETTLSYMEETIVHSGSQSMPIYYDNNQQGKLKYSEVEKTLSSGRNWTREGVGVLTIWFQGVASNGAESLYVALNGNAVVTHDNPNAAQVEAWTEWTIDMQAFADQSVNLASVNTIAIGLGNKKNPVAGGSGTIYIDDIRLYRPTP